ncbi:MAG TPA: MMPL family transporter [Roseiarcus sp.]|nr:MMPL family transporter [Roseiarcus sp.]
MRIAFAAHHPRLTHGANHALHPDPMDRNDSAVIIAAIARAVRLSTHYAWLVIPGFLIAAILSAGYISRHIAINTDSSTLLSSSLPWRQQEIRLNQEFPQRTDQIIAVIDATTPEAADEAGAALVDALTLRSDVIRTFSRPDGGAFFARNGILFETIDEVRRDAADLIKAQPFLGTLAADPTLRGVLGALSQSIEGVRLKKTTLEDLKPAVTAIADALDRVTEGKHPAFSWRRLITGRAPEPSELRRFVNIQPVLDFHDLQPGGKATKAIRATIAKLGLTPDRGVRVRLTGPVALSDEEFATIADGAALNGAVTILVVLLVLRLALKQVRIILAVLINLAVGLSFTAAIGLWMVGALNLISVAFAVLFVGLGVDFGIQFSVRYRAERYADRDLQEALQATARGVAGPLLLAAASIAAAFYSFLPTAYVGLSELGLIAGTGMIVALATTVTLLPALLSVLKPAGEPAPIGWAALAPLDRFLDRRRNWVVGATLTAVILGLPLLGGLRFDFNPLDLRSKDAESVSTLLDLMRDPDTSPNEIDILESDLAHASALAERLRLLPEVAKVRTLLSFVPEDQDEKLAIIDDASFFFENTLNPDQIDAAPTPAETLQAINKTASDLWGAAGDLDSPAATQARRLASLLAGLAKAPQAASDEAERVLVTPLMTTLRQVRDLLTADHVTIDALPPSLRSDWISADGEVRIEVAPKGDANDNAVLHRFVETVRNAAPRATGTPIFVVEAAATIVKAFLQAAIWSLASIALILFVALRRWTDVALTLVPLLVAIVVTLEICVAIGLQLNFANIIALPLLLGVGVAFKIYYVMAWRAGETNFLQSSLTRAVFFSACTTATAFGSLWFSHHPGTSSMGKLMALSLATTLSAAVLFQPALLATQRKTHPEGLRGRAEKGRGVAKR